MLAPGSGSWRDKFNWASEHLDALKRDASDWVNKFNGGPPWSSTQSFEPDRNTPDIRHSMSGHFIASINQFADVPADWSLRLGDIFFAFRCALDHLAWHLVQNGGSPPQTEPERIRVQFPLSDDPGTYESYAGQCLPGVANKLRAVIKRHQPFDGKPQHLAILHSLNNIDKHREIQVVAVLHVINRVIPVERNFRPDGATATVLNSDHLPSHLRTGAELIRIHAIRTGPGEPDMVVNLQVTFAVGLEPDIWPNIVLDETLNGVRDEIQSIFSDVSSWLTARHLPPV